MTSHPPTSGAPDSPARTSPWRELGLAMGYEGPDLDSFTTSLHFLETLVPGLSSSKTFQAFSIRTKDEILESSSRRWSNSGMAWRGAYLTASTSESPNHDAASTLLDVITTQDVPLRYYLSPNAAKGILRRVESQNRRLFPPLWNALSRLAATETTENTGD